VPETPADLGALPYALYRAYDRKAMVAWVLELRRKDAMSTLALDPFIAIGVVLATALTDAAYVMFTSAVIARKRVPAASWSAI
jgi:hypothetical protein